MDLVARVGALRSTFIASSAFWPGKPSRDAFNIALMIPNEWLTAVKTRFPWGFFRL
jgi:hypothetical protein